jgi:hypothetical protein
VLGSSSVKFSNPLATLQQYWALISAHHGSTGSKKLCLRGYGNFLIEGMELFTDSIDSLLSNLSVNPSVSFSPDFLQKSPANVNITDVCKAVKDKVDQIIKEERKKLLKVVGKGEGKEDDLLNMSNLGMSLLTLSDCHNTSEQDIFEPETPRMLNDNLLDFENQYIPDKDYKMKKLNFIEKQFDASTFTKPKPSAQVESLLVKGFQRKGSNETFDARGNNPEENKSKPGRYSVQPLTMIKNNSDLGPILHAEKLCESEYLTMTKSSAGAIRREVPTSATIEKMEQKKSFGDFFIGRNRANTGEVSLKGSDLLRKTNDTSGLHVRGNSITSNNSSVEGRPRAESDFQPRDLRSKEKDKAIKLAALRKAGQGDSNPNFDRSDLAIDKTSITRKSTQGLERMASPMKDNFSSDSKSMTLKYNLVPDQLLTPRAKELMKTKMTHKSIPSKYHQELFKMMDSKSKAYDFSDSQMGDGGVYFIAKYVKDNQEIDTLRLDNCKISDDGLSILLHSMTSIKLDKLYLRDNQITKEGVETIKKFIQMKRGLHLINLKGNPLDKTLMTAYIKEFSQHKVILLV